VTIIEERRESQFQKVARLGVEAAQRRIEYVRDKTAEKHGAWVEKQREFASAIQAFLSGSR
jgi:hypothetical protein